MPLYMYKSLFRNKELLPTPVQIFGHGDSPIHTGHMQPHTATCQVTDTRGIATEVGFIDFPNVQPPPLSGRSYLEREETLPITREYVLTKYKDIFEGIGILPASKYHIQFKPDAKPVQHPPRSVPEKKKRANRDELERLGSIWFGGVSVTKPDGSIRLCLEPKDLSNCIKRNQYYTKTIVFVWSLNSSLIQVEEVRMKYCGLDSCF